MNGVFSRRASLAMMPLYLMLQVALLLAPQAHAGNKRPLTVTDSLTLRRILVNDGDSKAIHYSPDGKYFLVTLVQDDMDRNGVWAEIVVGRADSLQSAERHEIVARLFTRNGWDHETDRLPAIYPGPLGLGSLVWLSDNETVAFLWSDGDHPTQLFTLNVRTRELNQRTAHPMSVYGFAASADGSRIVFTTTADRTVGYKERMAAMRSNGFAVSSPDALQTLLMGHLDGVIPWNRLENYVVSASEQTSRKVSCHRIRCTSNLLASVTSFSPDGRYLIITAPVAQVEPDWSRYRDPDLVGALTAANQWPDSDDLRGRIAFVGLLDTTLATARPLLDAPRRSYGVQPAVVWSPDSRHILVGPTTMPVEHADESGLAGTSIARVEIATGRVSTIPVPASMRGKVRPVSWSSEGVITLSGDGTSLRLKSKGARWQSVERSEEHPEGSQAAVRIEIKEGLNEPPSLHAIETATGNSKLILDVEPRLRTEYTLGHVENAEWQGADGRVWAGRLHYPTGHVEGRRYPLVIQITGGRLSSNFSLLGENDLVGTAFAAQAMANRDMAVLSFSPGSALREVMETPDEPRTVVAAVEAAVAHFSSNGLALPERVGLVGYSRTGYYVEYLLTHSQHPFAAAVASDNVDHNYIQAILRWGIGGPFAMINGGAPFGEGLQSWLQNAPAFNAEKVRTPLRLEQGTGGVPWLLMHWEMYARLHYLKRPVELVLVPDAEQGSHPLVTPKQKRFSQEGTVDWMDFWLNGREEGVARKAEQYERWRTLREQQETLMAQWRAAGQRAADLPALRK